MIYQPAEDSYMLVPEVEKRAQGKKVLDVGTGSGILAQAAWRVGAREVLAVDIDEEVIGNLKNEEFETKKSDLLENVYGEFDLIVFNPPYLPNDEREDGESAKATSGGSRGDEIIVRFLENVGRHISPEGAVLMVVSSLTPLDRIEKIMEDKGLTKQVISSKKIFMEELWVWEITQLEDSSEPFDYSSY